MPILLEAATDADAAAIALVRSEAADALTRLHGRGHWSSGVTERGVLWGLKTSRVLVARQDGHLVGTLRLATKKPWAIDTAYFAPVTRAVYLTDMAVSPVAQRQGVGRLLVDAAKEVVREWPGEAIRLDAYDAAAGAAGFYLRCGFSEVGRVTYRGVPLIYFELLL
jgi:ribosomal protein S18 acetylase RimI-like enzyme